MQATANPTLSALLSPAVLNEAWDWLCHRRRDYPPSADVWWLRQHWKSEKPKLCQLLQSGEYQFEPLQHVTKSDGEKIELWSARDALVLKALTLVLRDAFQISDRCTHLKGNGGSKHAVRQLQNALPEYRFVFRTDVKSFYASIDHLTVYEQLCERIVDKGLRRLLWQYLRRTVEHGGLFRDVEKGISLGCPLSPLIGAICLMPVDELLTDGNLFYVRFMDDWVVLAKTRRHLRRAVKQTNQLLSKLKLEKHPDKTFIGLIEKGFDFLGYHFSRNGLQIAQTTLTNFYRKAARLYEQSPSAPEGAERVGRYIKRWLGWCNFLYSDNSSIRASNAVRQTWTSSVVNCGSGAVIH